ncbi:hypothetical protein KIN20_000008 [Parelaphostrongylus tenuis]|uniref:Uncharacterized protein n=1 Tax=Parelaphostrongylus tenuis TaxID=148309 RepID=A0AAD5LRI1_PARTN|nr:hypothetical protein KIN20_000008 [Parelaphostrongylus tenuis]
MLPDCGPYLVQGRFETVKSSHNLEKTFLWQAREVFSDHHLEFIYVPVLARPESTVDHILTVQYEEDLERAG